MALVDQYGIPYHRPYYDGASWAPGMREFRRGNPGPNVPVEAELSTLWSRNRQLNRNNPWAVGAQEAYVDNMIATGLAPEPVFIDEIIELLGDPETEANTKRIIRQRWDLWSKEADADGMTNIYGLQALAVATASESGECFVRKRIRRPQDGFYIPLQLQILEPDFVPYNSTITLARRSNTVKAGIEFDAIGRRQFYHMYRSHPGEAQKLGEPAPETVPVPASEVLHIADLRRASQVRFEPRNTPIIKTLMQIEMSNHANLTLQNVAALFGLIITKQEEEIISQFGGDQQQGTLGEGQPNEAGRSEVEMAPGEAIYLQPGEDVRTPSPPDIGNNYLPFNGLQHRAISRVWGLPYYTISGDMTGASFASLRADQNGMKRRILRKLETFKYQFCDGSYSWFIREAILAGLLDLPDYSIVPKLWHMANWNHVGWESTNPLQDANAEAVYLKNRTTSRRRIVAEKGGNFRDVVQENAEDEALMREKGVAFGEAPTTSNQIGPFSDRTETEEDEPVDDTEGNDDAA